MYISDEKKKIKHNGGSASVRLSVHLVPEVHTKSKHQFNSYWCNLSPTFIKQYRIQFHQHLDLLLKAFLDNEYAYCYYLTFKNRASYI
jgi:hypothetical protein